MVHCSRLRLLVYIRRLATAAASWPLLPAGDRRPFALGPNRRTMSWLDRGPSKTFASSISPGSGQDRGRRAGLEHSAPRSSKIEWPENERGRLPSSTTPQDLEVNLNTSGNFNDTNLNKKSLSLNVRSPKGLEIVKRLIAVSDIVIENFSSRVLRNWGLGYDVKPEI